MPATVRIGPPMPLDRLARLEPLAQPGCFAGPSHWMAGGRLYGGQLIGQAILAAARTVDRGLLPQSMHARFYVPGDIDAPVHYRVEQVVDQPGRALREVWASQGERMLFSGIFEFGAAGPTHPVARSPDGWVGPEHANWAPFEHSELFHGPDAYMGSVFEIRPHRPATDGDPASGPHQVFWLRPRQRGTLPADRVLHRALVAYLSDYRLVGATLARHEDPGAHAGFVAASLDHAFWWRGDARADDWLHFAHYSLTAHGGRALVTGVVRDRDGRVVGVLAQELLVRGDYARTRVVKSRGT